MGFQLLHILVANSEAALSRNDFDSEVIIKGAIVDLADLDE